MSNENKKQSKIKCKPNVKPRVTLVTCVVVAEVTLSAVMVSGDMTGSFSWTLAFTCSPFIRGEVTHTHRRTHLIHTAAFTSNI